MNELYIAPSMLMDVPPLAFLEVARDAGYHGVGLRLQKSPQFPIFPIVGDAPLIRDIRSALADSGLKVLDVLAFYLLPETDVRDYEPALSLGAQLGARYALTQGNDPDWGRLCATFDKFCAVASQCGLTPIIEFCPNRTLGTLGQTLELLEQTGHSDIPILVDPIHLVRSEGTHVVRHGHGVTFTRFRSVAPARHARFDSDCRRGCRARRPRISASRRRCAA